MKPLDPSHCPLCGETNNCQLCTSTPHKGPCWCEKADIPKTLLDQIPDHAKNKACLCQDCIQKAHPGVCVKTAPAMEL